MYFRFVDDVFFYFANQSRSVEFFERLNGLHEALRFTQEGEQGCSLPFLDVKVSRTDDGIITRMYRKPTSTGRYTRLAQRAIKSTSCVHWRTGFTLRKRVNRSVHPLSLTRSWRPCGPFCQKMATLAISWPSWLQEIILDVALVLDSVLQVPWPGKRADELVRKANNAIPLAYFAGAVRPVYRTTRAFSLPKNRLPTLSQSNLIYLYECRNRGKRHVGRTEQRVADRIDQHVPKHIFTEPEPGKKTRGQPPKERSNPAEGYDSAIACHLAANKACSWRYEVIDFSELMRARTKNHLNVLEAVYIGVLNPVLCKQKSFVTSLTLFQRTQRTHPP